MTPLEQIQEKVISLEQSLLSANPTMPLLLSQIHKTLKEYPECVTLLSEEEISIVVRGLERQTAFTLLTGSGSKNTKAKKERVANIGYDDL